MKKFKNIFKDNNRAFYVLLIMMIFGIATGLFMGTLNNYLHDVLSIGKLQRGIVELPRELPGLLLILLLALFYRQSEINILRIAIAVSLVGLIGISIVGTSLMPAIIMIVLWSGGEHLFMPVRSSLSIHLARKGNEGVALGSVRSAGNVGRVVGYGLVSITFFLMARFFPESTSFNNFRLIYFVAIAVLVLALIISFKIKSEGKTIKRKRLYFSKKYWRYYMLEIFFGSRKQVFLTFAPYVLIIKYRAGVELIAALYFTAHLTDIFIGPILGRLIDRVGYRIIIVWDAVILVFLSLLYGYSHIFFPQATAFIVISSVFVIDSILFVVGMARTMYVKSLSSSQEETTSTLSTGLSINHLISIIIAIAGGLLWDRLGIEVLFSVAAILGIGSFLFSLTLPNRDATDKCL